MDTDAEAAITTIMSAERRQPPTAHGLVSSRAASSGPRVIALVTSFCVTFACSMPEALAAKRPAAGKEVVYKTSGGEKQVMELYFPPNHDAAKARVPGVILFHGGGWAGGSLVQFREACDYLARRGLVTATANYRMLSKAEVQSLPEGESRKRVCVTDAKSAIRWFKAHADEFGVDPKRIVTGGGSAGGHISVLAALNDRGLDDSSDPQNVDTQVLGFLLFNPAFVMPGRDRDPDVDVFEHLDGDVPPFLFLFGSKDGWKPASDQLFTTLKQRRIPAKYFVAEDANHGFWLRDPWDALCLAECDAFLVSLGILAGPAPSPPAAGGSRLVEAK